MRDIKNLKPEELKNEIDPDLFSFKTTEEITPFTSGIIGQSRAVKAMDFGLRVKQEGYNIYMAGITGTGKTTYARTLTRRESKKHPVPPDLCYVFNFEEPEKPRALKLPAGTGIHLKKDMDNIIEELKVEIPKIFESEEYEEQKNRIMNRYQQLSNQIMEEFEIEVRDKGFILQQTVQGPLTVPIDEDGNPITQEDYQSLPEDKRKEIREKNQEIQNKMDAIMKKIRGLKTEAQEELENLEKSMVLSVVKPIINHLKEEYRFCQDILDYLDDVKNDIAKNLGMFKGDNKNKEAKKASLPFTMETGDDDFFVRYKVNLLVNNRDTEGAPVIVETNPTYYNLFGKIEGRSQFGTVTTDFTMIKGGAIHKANGGYLILKAKDILRNPYAWETLKRTLINQRIVVENIGEQYRTVPVLTLKPEPFDIKLKVIMIGNPMIYQLLYNHDEEFQKLFKIRAHFDVEMEKNNENIEKFASFIASVSNREGIKHFTAGAVAEVISYSSRLAGKKDKLSTRFNQIIEILYEASTWAELDNSSYVEASHVIKAVEEKERRANLVEEKMQEMIEKEQILLDVTGEKVGQINGLSVIQTGGYSFGRPSRITARTFMGRKGVINIEREAKMSGKIHNKGVLILSGFLGGKYARERPLTLSASLAFEQSYSGVDGDSATCAELIALLSALTGLPVKQNLAITGSLNQKGMVQPVGGINQKIEGFYKVCEAKGLTGKQGVIIPEQNTDNLMLKEDVIATVKRGEFHIYSIKEIDEAIELMFGLSAEEVHTKVEESLDKINEKAREFNREFKEGRKKEELAKIIIKYY
ncbi:Lon protease family protein [Halothermothrix orenii]|uniref:endopeptidase La n=1 Tax=Halothermothrix orenii (strain H 168 / OCM 544 / DSM 9562) TaxID=373903 RepID=B8D1M2_HALOH|nr:AAA family ATPase [Halothermothrix orenii]ACL69099.1 peptidase S16 lon domain protein [Halothermothrix orenii H 168]